MRLIALGIPAALVLGFAACEQYQPPADEDYAFHASFDRGQPHAQLDCDACHIVAAGVMLQLPGDTPDTNWVTRIPLQEGNPCLTCHPFLPNGPEGPEANANCDQLEATWTSDCATDATTRAPALLRSEKCRFDTFHVYEAVAPSCTGGGCHNYQNQTNWNYSGYDRFAECPDDGGGGGGGGGGALGPHAVGGFWQLEGGHEGVACVSCHPTGNYTEQSGQGDKCANCHTRADTTGGVAGHYPSPTGVELDRDCIACHVAADTDDYQVTYERFTFLWPSTWTEAAHDHGLQTGEADGFYVNHGSSYAVFSCESCHNEFAAEPSQPDDYRFQASVGRDDCQRCHDGATAPFPAEPFGHGAADTQTCQSCHQQGIPD